MTDTKVLVFEAASLNALLLKKYKYCTADVRCLLTEQLQQLNALHEYQVNRRIFIEKEIDPTLQNNINNILKKELNGVHKHE